MLELQRAGVGRQPNPSPPYRQGADAYQIGSPAPTLGQHNAQVLARLGLSPAQLADLETRGIIGSRPRMPRVRSSGSR